jgi:hypothetical protein
VSRLSRQCVILNISQPYRPPRPVTGIAFTRMNGLRCTIQDCLTMPWAYELNSLLEILMMGLFHLLLLPAGTVPCGWRLIAGFLLGRPGFIHRSYVIHGGQNGSVACIWVFRFIIPLRIESCKFLDVYLRLCLLACENASLTIVRSLCLLHCLISHHHLLYIFLSTADLLGFQPVKFWSRLGEVRGVVAGFLQRRLE